MDLGLIQSIRLQASCNAGLPASKIRPLERAALWLSISEKRCMEEGGLPWKWGYGCRALGSSFAGLKPSLRGWGHIFCVCAPQTGDDVEPVAKVESVALEK